MGNACSSNDENTVAAGTNATAQNDTPKAAPEVVDYDAVRAELLTIMDDDSWDDGSFAPLLIRLGWHSSGTYDKSDGTGGSNGATMRFKPEKDDPENAGLDKARAHLEPVKKKFPGISYADLWILAAYVAIEHTGGPVITFKPGRKDKTAKDAVKPGRLPAAEKGLTGGQDDEGRAKGWENLAQHVRGIFERIGISEQETVALLCGGHVYGRCHTEHSGYAGAWVEEPTKFSNEYAADMIEDEWMMAEHDTKVEGVPIPEEVRPAKGKVQYIGKWSPSEEKEELEALGAPDSDKYPVGRYKIVDDWINCRMGTEPDSPIIAQPKEGEEFDVVAVKLFGTAIRGRLDVGGWCSIVSSKGEPLMERTGDLSLEAGKFRVVKGGAKFALSYGENPMEKEDAEGKEELKAGQTIELESLSTKPESITIFGKIKGENKWVLVVSESHGPLFERVIEGYNEDPRKPIKGKLQVKHQMMLVSDMILLWDADYKKYLEVYAEDEEKLKEDFGAAYKKLTEKGL